MIKYINGNYFVTLDNEGTKTYRALRKREDFISEFPDSIDLKITNKCSIGCSFCHESSIKTGKSFNLDKTKKLLDQLPKVGIELAIGGGDVLEDSVIKDCSDLCKWAMKDDKFIPRLTINIKSLDTIEKRNKLHEYFMDVEVLGISIDRYDEEILDILDKEHTTYFKRKVYHIIAGLFPPEDLLKLINSKNSILILGYKDWGRAKGVLPKYDLKEWGKTLKRIMYRGVNSLSVIGFDNLAIEQLRIRDSMDEISWNKFFMGNEFSHTMYVDAVSEIFAPTSRDSFRVSWDKMGILEFFKKYKNDKVNNEK